MSWRVSCTGGSKESSIPRATPAVTVRADTTFESAAKQTTSAAQLLTDAQSEEPERTAALSTDAEGMQGGLVCPARENKMCKDAEVVIAVFGSGALFSLIAPMNLRTTLIRIVVRVRCSCPYELLRVVTFDTSS